MKTNDYVKYVTQQLVQYMDQPKEIRKTKRIEKKEARDPFFNRWFGMIPLSFQIWYRNTKKGKK
ncbi:YqzE family protein [Priestia aryabhattai]|uniref:YqzE family protein n=1 Tax=Bacillaceae TaxID=186817 RepID=UPI000B9FCD91|nr:MULTISPECIES: YqzE family protein [Bacillaceae]MDT2045488.1 YqzE family protein [Priestia flexa]OZT13455.1 YqzE family protein [Priestia aryabhattai]TDB50764.1 YqzE family protein [Bacillus sp. CBEL-1]USY54455.1 YqzE family protein [Bacillus sp. 1780r2a1]